MLRNLTRYWLVGILFIFPFLKIVTISLETGKYKNAVIFFRFIDEGTIFILLIISLWKLFRSRDILNSHYLLLACPIAVFCIFGLISGIVNGNSFHITVLGVFDYVKYFLVPFIYAVFFRESDNYIKIYRYLLIFAVIISAIAIVEEIWALTSRYVLDKHLLDSSMYLFRSPPPSVEQSPGSWRFGIYRASSIIMKIDWLGYYCLFVLTIYLFLYKKYNKLIIFLLISGILVTVTRSAYAGLTILLLFYLLLRKINDKRIIFASVILVIASLSILSSLSFDVDGLGLKDRNAITYREFARGKGIEIWKDHPIVGVGPGMFGGVVSKIFKSPIYEEYNFPFSYIRWIGGIDQYWPQVFAEIGTIGLILYAGLIIALVKLLLLLKQCATDEDTRNMLKGLLVFLLVIFVYTFGTGFNTVTVVFPFFAFIGILLGSIRKIEKKM